MSTLLESLPKEIARLEEKYGSGSRSAKLLRQQLDGILHNQGKTAEEVYRMQAVKLPLKGSNKGEE